MTAVLVVALVAPLVAAAAPFIGDDRRASVALQAFAGVGVAAWAVVASVDEVTLGAIRVDALAPPIAVGVLLAGTVAARRPREDPWISSLTMVGSALLAALAAAGQRPVDALARIGPPDTPAVVAFAVVGLALATMLVIRRGGMADTALVAASGLAATVAAVGVEADPAGTGAVIATSLAVAGVAAALVRPGARSAIVLMPVTLAIAARLTHNGTQDDLDAVAVGVAVGAVLVVVLTSVAARRIVLDVRAAPAGAAGLLAVAFLVLVVEADHARSSGLLLAAGAVLMAASRDRIGLLALWPGVATALTAVAMGDGTMIALVLMAMVLSTMVVAASWAGPRVLRSAGTTVGTVAAVAFAAMPALWSWADPPELQAGRSIVFVLAALVLGAVIVTAAGQAASLRAADPEQDADTLPGSDSDGEPSADLGVSS